MPTLPRVRIRPLDLHNPRSLLRRDVQIRPLRHPSGNDEEARLRWRAHFFLLLRRVLRAIARTKPGGREMPTKRAVVG